MFVKLTPLKRKLNPFVWNVRNLTQRPQLLKSGSSALHVINWPTNFARGSATSIILATATLMTTLTIPQLHIVVMQ
jgi:hypothetical protein